MLVKMEWEALSGAEQYNALLDAARRVPSWCQSRKDSDGKPAPVSFGEWMRDGSESWGDACRTVAAAGYCVMEKYITRADELGKPLYYALYCATMAAAQRQHYFLHPGRRTRHGEPVSLNGLLEAGFEPSAEDDYSGVEIVDAVRRSCRDGDENIVKSRIQGYSFSEIETVSGIRSVNARQRVSRLGRRVSAAMAD